MEWVNSFIRKEIIGREEKYLEGKRRSETMFYKGNTVLSRRNYSYWRNTLDGKLGENMLVMINILIAKYFDEEKIVMREIIGM